MKYVIDISENRLDALRMFYKDCQDNLSTSDIAVVEGKPLDDVLDEIKAEFKSKADGDDWYHTTDGLVWGEAIEILDRYAHHSHSEVIKYPREVAAEAFEMAIQALEQEPYEDAVSRTDTLQSFESYCENNCQYSKKQRDVMCGACMMGDAIEIVESLPPVTPKQRTGKWVKIETGHSVYYKC